jgi:hypothetical protein
MKKIYISEELVDNLPPEEQQLFREVVEAQLLNSITEENIQKLCKKTAMMNESILINLSTQFKALKLTNPPEPMRLLIVRHVLLQDEIANANINLKKMTKLMNVYNRVIMNFYRRINSGMPLKNEMNSILKIKDAVQKLADIHQKIMPQLTGLHEKFKKLKREVEGDMN